MNEGMFLYGTQLTDKDYGDHRIELKFATRMCRTHATYVLKDRPNINVPPIAPDVSELRQHAGNIERALNAWWDDQKIMRKIKSGILTASYKGDFVWFLSVDKEKKNISFNQLQPDLFTYDRVTQDPYSPMRWVMRADLINADDLKAYYPKYAPLISPSGLNARFLSFTNFYRSDLYNIEKALYIELMDEKYIYKYVNDIEVEVIEHNYPFIPYYHFKYFDVGQKFGMSLMSFIKDPVRFLNQLVGYQFDMALKVANPPLVITGGNADIDGNNLRGGKISIPQGSIIQYLNPPAANIQLDKMTEMMRQFMHFLSGLNEETMAGFTGALTAAGVSVELRLDATVREALDVQVHLQDILQSVNADYLRLFEKFFPNKNMFETDMGIIFDQKFPGKMIGKYYKNTVDFGGVLPRSDSETVRNVLAKKQAGLISSDTALEEMRYSDPTIELNKVRAEKIEEAKLAQILQAGGQPDQKFFDNPKEEEDYMLTSEKLAIPHPSQDHEGHLRSHEARYARQPLPILMQHIMMTKAMMKQGNQMAGLPANLPQREAPGQFPEEQQAPEAPQQQQF